MNANEVIHQLKSLIDNSNSFHEEQNDIWEQDVKALKIAMRAVKEKQERENPKPLTIGELRQMDGEPVWIVMFHGSEPTKCEIISEICTEGIKLVSTDDLHDYASFGLYGITWLAYRYEPNHSADMGEMEHIGEANGKVKRSADNNKTIKEDKQNERKNKAYS